MQSKLQIKIAASKLLRRKNNSKSVSSHTPLSDRHFLGQHSTLNEQLPLTPPQPNELVEIEKLPLPGQNWIIRSFETTKLKIIKNGNQMLASKIFKIFYQIKIKLIVNKPLINIIDFKCRSIWFYENDKNIFILFIFLYY